MFRLNKGMQQQLKNWLWAALLIGLGALAGQQKFPSGPKTSAQTPISGAVKGAGRAIDGDSLWVGRDEVRLKGIDAPEGRQSCTRNGSPWDCGNASRDELRRLIGKDVVECQAVERDKHGRVLGYCKAGGRDLNAGMVAAGLAVAYGGFLREEGVAKARKRGLWAGEFERPRDWRHERGIGL
jgi:endonuclease YncB( thermonuclease family)